MEEGSNRQAWRRSDARSGQDEALQPSIDRAFGPSTGQPMTRRRFLGRAAALGISASALGLSLDGCATSAEQSGSAPTGTSSRGDSAVHPTPKAATYGAMLEATELAVGAIPPGGLRALLDEVAAGVGIVVSAAAAGRRQAHLTVTADDPSIVSQGYRLEVAPGNDGPLVTIRAGDEAGAYYGFLSLGQLIVADGSTHRVRAATIDDAPAFLRRGAILDPAPLTGVSTDASRADLLRRVKVGVGHKLNFVDLAGRTPWPELVRYCDDHHVELMVAWGYRDGLTTTGRQVLKDQLAEQLAAGARSISLCWDDIPTTDPEGLARRHLDVFLDLYDFLRGWDPQLRLSAVLPPYGGIPGQNLVASQQGSGERYLGVMREALPPDVRVFWTGDGGVFSEKVTSAGAKAYGDAVGHEIGLWDNDTIRFSQSRRPCSGRAADLPSVVRSYMGNLVGENLWSGTNGEFALLTSLFYTWNPTAYEPAAAAATVERILAG